MERKIAKRESNLEPKREPGLCPSEVMTLVILFHIVGYRNFKTFYNGYTLNHLKKDFPNLPSYNRFVELKSQLVFPLHSLPNFLVNLLSGSIAYTLRPKKPSLHLRENDLNLLMAS